MSELLRDIDEAYRRERWQKLWQTFGSYIITLSFLILACLIAVVAWQSYRDELYQDWTSALLQASEARSVGNSEEAEALLQPLHEESNEVFSRIAGLWLAQLAMQQGEMEQATSLLNELGGDITSNDAYRAYGGLLALYGTTPKEAISLPTNGIFRLTAEEIKAMKLLETGQTEAARSIMASLLVDAQTPASMRERLTLLLADLGPAAAVPTSQEAPPDETEETEATPAEE